MTGRYPLTHGVFLNDVRLGDDEISIAKVYNKAGYETDLEINDNGTIEISIESVGDHFAHTTLKKEDAKRIYEAMKRYYERSK